MKHYISLLLYLYCCTVVLCQNDNEAPRFTHEMNGFSLEEATPIGTPVFQLKGVDPENQPLQFGINADMFVVSNASTGDVYVSQKLDYERERSFSIVQWISDGVNRVEREAQINILDVNDELPQFTQETYKVTFRESAQVGDIVYRGLTVTDADAIGNIIQVTCVDTSAGSCSVFDINVKSQSNREWVADLVLRRVLDYEAPNRPTQLRLEARDGANTKVQSVEIELLDIQDTPPSFSGSITAVINENVPMSSPVIRMVARDGDEDSDRPIQYSLTSNPGGLFSIDRVSGDVITAAPIDSESSMLRGGFVKIRVKACEMYNASAVDTSPKSCAEVEVTITVVDLNDNAPVITPQSGEFEVDESIENGMALPDIELKVTDKDLGARSEFALRLLNYGNIFKLVPDVGTGFVTASIVVIDEDMIDYDLKQRVFILQIVAEETKTAERLRSEAVITVKLVDENDNTPTFAQSSYTASVKETASSRTPVIRITANDLDSGFHGTSGIRYKLRGVGADLFSVDPLSGQIVVRGCFNPGKEGCIDYERMQKFDLQFVATDDLGEGKYDQVPLTINVINENDNRPKFNLPSYVSYIEEGETELDPELIVQATDADNDPVTYSILTGNVGNQWQIDPTTGEITATREVDYEATPGGLGYYNLTVQAADPLFRVQASARIIVIDSNDHEPVFRPAYYEVSIPEDTLPGVLVETVLATDADPSNGPNGQVQYRISGGSQDQFQIDPTSGRIVVAPGAKFDYDVKKRYEMTVIGQDQGQPQKQAQATVVVKILDSNNKNPFFRPATIRTEVLENEPIGASVITVKAEDPDSAAELVYYFEEPRTAIDPNSNPVDVNDYDFTNLFSIERNTGRVKVNQPLEYNRVARVTFTVRVVDNSAVGPTQSALATLIITILKVNDRPPIFGPPWTPERPFFDVTVREEQSEGSYITTLVASDPTDTIDEYKLISNPGDHFQIDPQTGVVTVAIPLDYETDKRLEVVAVAIDNGQPQLTATATINVQITNINDENPEFGQELYEVEIYENSPAGTPVVRVQATDLDLEDFGVVRYQLDENDGQFVIDTLTGQITVAEGAVLDRETDPVITLTATVYDSPNHPDVRRSTSVPVYIILLDENDESPSFMQREYRKNILENVPPGTSVIQLTSFDADEGDNARVTYKIISGNDNDFFTIDPDTGLVSTDTPLIGFSGSYNLSIQVTDGGNPSNSGYGFLYITVLPANNGAPQWVVPSKNNVTIYVLENQYLGMEVTTVYATDEDEITYGFQYQGEFVSETPDFEINPYTGVITAKRVFDREEKDSYTLLLIARDSGSPPFDTPRYLIIQILDTDDHDPVFPTFRNCCTIPYGRLVSEDTAVQTVLVTVKAVDKDIGENADVEYYILSGNDDNTFILDPDTGVLSLNGELNHEVRSRYELTIEAQDGYQSAPELQPSCRCQNPSLVKVIIIVVDSNDRGVVFPVDYFTACVPVDASIGRHVTTIIATDPDTDATTGFLFSLSGIVNHRGQGRARPDSFLIGNTDGFVSTNTLMVRYEDQYFTMNVRVTDQGGIPTDTELKVWVTSPSQEVTLTFESTISQVEAELPNIIAAIQRLTNNGTVCIEDLRYHVTAQGVVVKDWTDLVIYVVDGNGLNVIDAGVVVVIIGDSDELMGAYGVLAIKEAYGGAWAFVTWPILAAIIVIALLILLALLMLCVLCNCCMWGAFYDEEYYAVKEPIVFADTTNPLWQLKLNEYEDQELTMSMKDYAAAGGGMVNRAFEASEGLGNGSAATAALHHETHSSHMSTRMETKMEDTVDAVTTDDVRIEAALEASTNDLTKGSRSELGARNGVAGSAALSSSSMQHLNQTYSSVHVERTQMGSYEAQLGAGAKPSMISEATMTDRQPTYVAPPTPASPAHSSHGPALIGATLTTRQYRQKVVGETYSDIGDYRSAGLSTYQPPPQSVPLRHESMQNSSYYGEPVFSTGSMGSTRDMLNYNGGGPISPGGGAMSDLGSQYEGTIHLGTLSTGGGGGSMARPGRHYRETHERREYEEGYINGDDVFVYPS